ncbi:DUF5011 domain-containing protein [Mycoplasmatota bacterium zrk1]
MRKYIFMMIFLLSGCGIFDNVPPEIILEGGSEITITLGKEFIDPGYTVTDNSKKEVSVNVESNLNVNKLGTHEIKYTAIDVNDNEAVVKRVINVIDITPPTISLNGEKHITLEISRAFEDPGVVASDNSKNEVEIIVDSNLDYNKLGNYEITYTARDSSGNRNIIRRLVTVEDTTPPIIRLKGPEELQLSINQNFIDTGFTVKDNSNAVVTTILEGSVDISTSGTYKLIYTAKDPSGNISTVERIVCINDYTEHLYEDLTIGSGIPFFIDDLIEEESKTIGIILQGKIYNIDIRNIGEMDQENVLKEKEFVFNIDGVRQSQFIMRKIYETNFNKFLYTGTKFDKLGAHTFIFRARSSGYVDWLYNIEHPGSVPFPGVITESDGYLIYGSLKDFDTVTGQETYNTYLVKIDKSGEKMWEGLYPSQNKGKDYIVKGDDAYYILLYNENYSTLLKVSLDGKETSYINVEPFKPWGIFKSSDGKILLYGRSSILEGMVYSFDGENFTEEYSLGKYNVLGQLELKDSTLIYYGVRDNSTVEEIIISRVSSEGELLNRFSYESGNWEHIDKIIEVEDGIISYSYDLEKETIRLQHIKY